MHPDRWHTIEELFHAALQHPPQQRSKFLDEVCANDPELRREVESLLNETPVVKEFMERPAGGLSLASLDFKRQTSLEGRVLGHYRIGPMVGSGGSAEVYRARDTRLERDVAIKLLHNVQLLDREARQRMYREARVLATLNHPNIASIYGIEESDGLCGLVLEFVEGDSLAEGVARGSFSVPMALAVATQIASGLHAAHAKGIIHRDLKPSNVKITPDGNVKIIDFGIAKLIHALDSQSSGPDISGLGLVIGTPRYMSPEQTRGKAIDVRTDIWAFGCVLYELLSGKPAFVGETPSDLIVKIVTEEPDWNSIPRVPEAISDELAGLIRKCMRKDPGFRYQSVSALSTELQLIQQGQGVPKQSLPRPPLKGEDDFVLPVRFGRSLFLLAQTGYVALYAAAMFHVDAIARILEVDFQIPESSGLIGTLVLAMCGVAVRIYLISAVGWRHPAAGQKFTLLFPILLALDSIWAAAPLLLWRRIGYGLALMGVAILAYVPFGQRTLMRTIYPRRPVGTQNV